MKESLRISFRTNNIKDAVTISDEIAKNLQRQLTKISYSKDEQDTLVELYFINFWKIACIKKLQSKIQ